MGAAVTVRRTHIKDWSAVDLGNAVASIGDAYTAYSSYFSSNAVDGEFICGLSQSELMDCMTDIGISNKMHQKKLVGELTKLNSSERTTEKMPNSSLLDSTARPQRLLCSTVDYHSTVDGSSPFSPPVM